MRHRVESGQNESLPLLATALNTANEAVEIRRELASAQPDAFEPYLGNALRTLANRLDEVERKQDALVANSEAISKLKRSFLKHPPSFIHWMIPMCRQYIQRCEVLGESPDVELLGPIVETIQAMEQE